MKKTLNIITALLFALQVWAQSITPKQGDALSILIVFQDTVTAGRQKDMSAFLGASEIGRKSLGTIKTTNDKKVFRIDLASKDTKSKEGTILFQLATYDSTMGVRRITPIPFKFLSSNNTFNNTAISTTVDVTVNVTITSLGVTSNVTLATVQRGYSAYDIAVQAGYSGTEFQWVTAFNTAINSVTTSAASATAAAASATTASTQATNAASSASAASTSATNSANSATAAATSAAAAAASVVSTMLKANNLSDVANAATARTNLGVAIGSNVQAWDADLSTIAGLTATTDNFLVGVSSAWASRTPAQVRTTLGLVPGTDVAAQSSLANYFPIVGGTLTGTAGAGYHGFIAQSAAPSTPSTGFRFYANSSNALSWIGANGYTRTFDGTSNTANRSYTLPDASGTFGLLGSAQTWSAVNTFSGLLQAASNIAWSTGGSTGSSGKNVHIGYDNTNSIGYVKSINTGTAFTDLRFGSSALSFWTGSSSLTERAGITGTGLLYANSGISIGKGTITSGRLLDLSAASPYIIFSPTTGGGVSNYTMGVDNYGFVLYDDTQAGYRMVVKNNGNVIIGGFVDTGYKLKVDGSTFMGGTVNVAAGSNKAVSTATLSGGTVTVSNTTVTASSIIYVTGQNCSSCGSYYISAKSAGTSFTITSTNASDASTVAFLIVN